MLFSEYYGEYYACVAEILAEAVEGTLTKERIREIAAKQGFGESVLTIPANLQNVCLLYGIGLFLLCYGIQLPDLL